MEKKGKSGFKKKRHGQGLPVINPHAAGIDVGGTQYDVAISDGESGYGTREHPSFTEGLAGLANWLKTEGITTVAIESTGVYWLSLYLMLEDAGIGPYLANAKHAKGVTGRKKDGTDAIWLQKLHCCGLLRKGFQPEGGIRVLRTYVRQRKNLISISPDSVRRMQKAFGPMNIKTHTAISDVLGKTGLQMPRAILAGERNANGSVKLKDARIKASEADLKKSLTGIWKDEYLSMLEQAHDGYMFYHTQINECEGKIQQVLLSRAAQLPDGGITNLPPPPVRKKKPKKNGLSHGILPLLVILAGVDPSRVDGISETPFLGIVSETGTDMGKWKNDKHFAAWLNVAPNTKITGGKIISGKMQKKKNHAGQTFRMAANSLKNRKPPLGDHARKMRSRLGKRAGNVASAHKLAKIVFAMLKDKVPYNPDTVRLAQTKWEEDRTAYLEKQIAQLKKAC